MNTAMKVMIVLMSCRAVGRMNSKDQYSNCRHARAKYFRISPILGDPPT